MGVDARQAIVRALRRRDADRRLRRHPQGRRRRTARRHRASCRKAPPPPKAISTATASRSTSRSSSPSPSPSRTASRISISPICAPQAKGPVNLRPSMAEACVFYSLIGSLGPTSAYNDGMRDAVRITYAPHTIVNADPPGAGVELSDGQPAAGRRDPGSAGAFQPEPRASRIPARRARSASPGARAGPARSTMQYEIAGSAYGGGMGHDGATGAATHLSNLHTTPIEVLESEFPCRITRFDLVPDSGGAGQWRGGLARAARIRAAGGRDRDPPLQQDALSAQGRRRRQGRRAGPLRGAGRHATRNTRRRPRRGSRCWRASASCCKARAAAAMAIRASATARRDPRHRGGLRVEGSRSERYGQNE